ncbi:hypothetical protein QQ008_00520 [Fulvivirgaceae bacterium BMA10]|uniref:Uncharacterized protein n=1 Tax=Splendidivirga corallicola TaxID=3051826 RepID=A0ABT8KGH6_9BACT|nr:hypothetical protein [Fulvivirgaceae bacterium BMA10]
MKVYESEFMIINHLPESQTLELIWKEETGNMVDWDFKATLYVYAGFAIEYQVHNLLVHIHHFRFGGAMSDELTTWRDKEVFPKYNEAGVLKFAFWGDASQLPPQDPPKSPVANFDTRFFSERADVDAWFEE